MSEKMLVTQALDERDLLVKKIGDKIAKASFVDTVRPKMKTRSMQSGSTGQNMRKRRKLPISRSLT